MENEIGTAARRQCQSILGEIIWPAQQERIKNMIPSKDAQVIDMTCGSGTSTLGLLALQSVQNVYAFDFDPVNIATTRSKAAAINLQGKLHLYAERFETSDFGQQVDLIIGTSILNNLESNQAAIQKAWDGLVPGGKLILDFVDFSGSQGFPRSYALDQYNEYMRLYQQVLGLELTASGIRDLASAHRFVQLSVESLIPRFLEPQHRKLPSLILEYLTSFIVDNGVSSQVELEAIISELRHLAGRPEMMISGPMTLQLCAVKS